jgi:hypothetical protein
VKRKKGLRRTPIKRTQWDPKRSRLYNRRSRISRERGLHVASPLEWETIAAAKAGPCRVCGATRISFHHLAGGNYRHDHADNVIPLCGDGSRGCHGIYTSHWTGESYDGQTRTWADVADAIRRSLTPSETAYLISLRGEDWLDRRYPLKR